MYRPTTVQHVEFPEGWRPFDARPVFAEINRAGERLGRVILEAQEQKHLGEISLHLATRARILKVCVDQNTRLLQRFIDEVRDSNRELIRINDETLFLLLLFIDSFLFESKSYEVLLRRFFLGVLQVVMKKTGKVARGNMRNSWRRAGRVDGSTWIAFLEERRNSFSHEAAPWIAVDTSRASEGIYDLLAMAENLHDFALADRKSFFLVVRDFKSVLLAIQVHAKAIQEYLIHSISKL